MGTVMDAIVEIFVPASEHRGDHWTDVAEVQFNKDYPVREAAYRLTPGWPDDVSLAPWERSDRMIETGLHHGTREEFENAVKAAERDDAEDAPCSTTLAVIEFARVLEQRGERVRLLFYTS